MIVNELVPNQYWTIQDFFGRDKLNLVKSMYRQNRSSFSMVYDNRLLTDYNNTPELQEILHQYTPYISSLVGVSLTPQVAYVSIDLPGSRIMMHRLHQDIAVQIQVPLGGFHDYLGYSICTDQQINNADSNDYSPIRAITKFNSVTADYYPDKANVFYNNPRAFVGMIDSVPSNHIREVIVMSYQLK